MDQWQFARVSESSESHNAHGACVVLLFTYMSTHMHMHFCGYRGEGLGMHPPLSSRASLYFHVKPLEAAVLQVSRARSQEWACSTRAPFLGAHSITDLCSITLIIFGAVNLSMAQNHGDNCLSLSGLAVGSMGPAGGWGALWWVHQGLMA